MKNGLSLLILFIAAACFLCAQGKQANQSSTADPIVSRFAVSELPAVQALLQLSRSEHVPLGIVENDQRLCETRVSYAGENVSASTIAEEIATQVPGYVWQRDSNSQISLILPVSPQPSATQFLSIVESRFGPIKGNVQMIGTMLWVYIRATLYPSQGTGGSVLGSLTDRSFTFEARNENIQEILNRIAILSKGTWILRPLPPTLINLGSELPFSIFSDAGQTSEIIPGNLCTPVSEANNK